MKNKKMKVLLSTLLATNMLLMAPALPVMAEESKSAVMELTHAPILMSVDVPLTLPIAVDAQGGVTTAKDVMIVNNSPAKIKVKKVTFTETNDWSIKDYDENFNEYGMNSKNIGLIFNKDKVTSTKEINTTNTNWPSITSMKGLPITYNAKVSPQSTELSIEPVTVSFVIDWDMTDDPSSGVPLAISFSGTKNGNFQFTGTSTTVKIPHIINTIPVTSYTGMFSKTSVEKVINTNPNITSMSAMFKDSKATTLDLSELDTSNVTYMNQMFFGSQATSLDLSSFDTLNVTTMSYMFKDFQATTLDLSSFDTSNVTDMSWMFHSSKATTLDLSSFDTSNVTDMSYMFYNSEATSLDLSSFDTSNVTDTKWMFMGSQATTGYARTQSDADRLNASYGKPSGLTFTVK